VGDGGRPAADPWCDRARAVRLDSAPSLDRVEPIGIGLQLWCERTALGHSCLADPATGWKQLNRHDRINLPLASRSPLL